MEGKGSFLNSSGMKEFAKEMIDRGRREFVIDLANCSVMDSTFMGTMAGIALRMRELGEGHLHVVNLNERNRDLLSNLGLDQLFAMELCPVAASASPDHKPLAQPSSGSHDPTEQAKTMLAAHEALVEAAPENLSKFKDVLEFLKQDLKSAS